MPREVVNRAMALHGAQWSEFVWLNQLRKKLPEELEFLGSESLSVGPMLDTSNEQVERLSAEGETHHCLRALRMVTGESATQYCFKGIAKIDEADAVSKVWLEMNWSK